MGSQIPNLISRGMAGNEVSKSRVPFKSLFFIKIIHSSLTLFHESYDNKYALQSDHFQAVYLHAFLLLVCLEGSGTILQVNVCMQAFSTG